MPDAFLAVDAATDLRAHARHLRRRWDEMAAGDDLVVPVRPVVAQSWSRMTGAGLDPERLRPRPALETDALAAARASSTLRHALRALRSHLGAIADDAQHVMVVSDAAGRLLWLEGHPRVREQAQTIMFEPGMLWTEGSAGTNAIGTALAIEHPVQIFSAEHFLPEQHPWWCSAAPLHDPTTGELLGVVDVSGPQRTAHPYSLTLVTAAARIAEAALRERQIARDDRLRRAYVERIRRSRGTSSALVDDRGRVLLATPADWVGRAVAPPPTTGQMTLPSGQRVEAEALAENAWVLWAVDHRSARSARTSVRPRLDLELLGRHGHTVRVTGAPVQSLSLRHAEALALLAMEPDGLTAEQLTLRLYGERGKDVTTRAQMSRLRAVVGSCLRARPYRLVADVHADFVEVADLLAAGEVTRALAWYRGPLLDASEVERVAEVRRELSASVRRAAMGGTPDNLWAWLTSEDGREDLAAMQAFLRRADGTDPRRAAIATRLHAAEPGLLDA